jgi:hypothetical protein
MKNYGHNRKDFRNAIQPCSYYDEKNLFSHVTSYELRDELAFLLTFTVFLPRDHSN